MWSYQSSLGSRGPAVLLLAMASMSITTAESDCSPLPIVSPIREVTLSNGRTARGMALSIGTPEQELAFLPRW
jgi:hypothetical protein